MVNEGNYDVGYTWFTFHLKRSKLVDFSYAVMTSSNGLFYVKGSNDVSINLFMKPFRYWTWKSVSIYFTLLLIGYLIIDLQLISKSNHNNSFISVVLISSLKSMNFTLRSFIAKRIGHEPLRYSGRAAFFVVILSGFFIFTFYRASLVAFIAVDVDAPPVRSLSEIRMSNYHLALSKNSVYDDMFKLAKRDPHDSVEKLLAKSNKIVKYLGSTPTYIDNMVMGKKNTVNSILFWTRTAAKFNKHYPCRLASIDSASKNAIQGVGMIFKKKWPYKKLLDYNLLKMREQGMLDRLLAPYQKNEKQSCPNEEKIRSTLKRPNPIGSEKTFFLYSILSTGFIFALVLLCFEMIYQKLNYKN